MWTYGWRLYDGEPPSAELIQNIGPIRLCAAEPGARQLLLRGSMDRPEAAGSYRLLINGRALAWRPPATRVALRYGPLKAIYAPLEDRLELYGVTNDPAEIDDLSAARPLSGLLMRQAVLEQMELNGGLFATEAAAGAPLDPAVEDGLRALGYLGEQ